MVFEKSEGADHRPAPEELGGMLRTTLYHRPEHR